MATSPAALAHPGFSLKQLSEAPIEDVRLCVAKFSYVAEYTGWDSSESSAEALLEHRKLPDGWDRNKEYQYIIEHAGQIIGYTTWYQGAFDPGTVFLGFLGIFPAFQNQGLASRVYMHLEQRFRDDGFHTLLINVGSRNVPALAFWLKQGFLSITSFRRTGPDNQFLDMIMKKTL